MTNFQAYLQEKIEERNRKGLLRTLVDMDNKIDFSSNDYFGFSRSTQFNINDESLGYGGTGSRSITGNHRLAEIAEKTIAHFHQQEAALLFNSGYMANVGLFSCIAFKGDTFISDEFIHASIIDGMRLSHANRIRFKHNNLIDLEAKLQKTDGRKFVAVESIYSMDGDEAPLVEIADLCKKYEALLIVDEAHATGVMGDKGEGLVGKYRLQKEVLAVVYTYGKAVGLHGAAVAGSNILRDYLINNARSFIFTTALPPHTYLQIKNAYDLLPIANRDGLFKLIAYFRSEIKKINDIQFLDSHTPIQGILTGDNFKAKSLATHLQSKNIFIRAILSPTVPVGKERLRICIHTFNSEEQIDLLLNETKNFLS